MQRLRENIEHLIQRDPTLGTSLSKDPSLWELSELASKAGVSMEDLFLFPLGSNDLPWRDIRFVFLDVDGVLTEGGMFYTESGDEFKRFDTKDGMAIKVGMQHGLQFGIISSGVNTSIIQHRADMFGIQHVYVGTEPKLHIAEKWLKELGVQWSEVAYIGDDVNDLDMFERSAIAACPADATVPIKHAADLVLLAKGGHGCVREFMRCMPMLKKKL